MTGSRAVEHPFRWKLWTLPAHLVGYVLVVDFGTVGLAVWASARTATTRDQWVLCAVLAVSAAVHLHLSNGIERVRRDHSHTPHIDLRGTWVIAAALLLLPLPAILLTIGICIHRWWLVLRWDASRPPHRVVFNLATTVMAAVVVAELASLSGLRDALLGSFALTWVDGVALLSAIAAYLTINSGLVLLAVVMTTRLRGWKAALGSATDNLLEVGQLVLGVFVAVTMSRWLGFALLMVVPVIALHRTVLLHQLQLAARTDDKTGLLNATTWHKQAEIELLRARHENRSMGLFMVDLDLFSAVNNSYGHLAGDAVLRRVAHLLTSSVRRGDSIGRFGGEEFAVLLPGVDRREALAVAERIRNRMHKVSVPDGAGNDITGLTVSIGVAIYPEVVEDTLDGLLAAADAALYEAKRDGRDQVRIAGEQRVLPWLPTARRVAEDVDAGTDGE